MVRKISQRYSALLTSLIRGSAAPSGCDSREIIERHTARGEARLELFRIACLFKPERRSTAATALVSSHDETGQTVVDDLRDRAAVVGDSGVGSPITGPERSAD